MGRLSQLILVVAASALLGGAAGCASSEEPSVKTDSFKSTAMPADYVKEKMRLRDAAPKPGAPAAPR